MISLAEGLVYNDMISRVMPRSFIGMTFNKKCISGRDPFGHERDKKGFHRVNNE